MQHQNLDSTTPDGSTCGILFSDGGPHDNHGCLRESGHSGPHEFIDQSGRRWCWETDFNCQCEHCQQCDGDYCSVYWPKQA